MEAELPFEKWPRVWRVRGRPEAVVVSCKYMSPGREKLKDGMLGLLFLPGLFYLWSWYPEVAYWAAGVFQWRWTNVILIVGMPAAWFGLTLLLVFLSQPWAWLFGRRLRIVLAPEGMKVGRKFYSFGFEPEVRLEVPPKSRSAQRRMMREEERAARGKLTKRYHTDAGQIVLGYLARDVELATVYNPYRARTLALRINYLMGLVGRGLVDESIPEAGPGGPLVWKLAPLAADVAALCGLWLAFAYGVVWLFVDVLGNPPAVLGVATVTVVQGIGLVVGLPLVLWLRHEYYRPWLNRLGGPAAETGRAQPESGPAGAQEEEEAFADPFADEDEPRPRGRERMSRAQALEILGLTEVASEADMKAAYRRLMMKVHPDTGGTNHFAKLLNEARQVLGF